LSSLDYFFVPGQKELDNAADGGQFEIIEWIQNERRKGLKPLKISQVGLSSSAGNGHIDMVEYIINQQDLDTQKIYQYGINAAAGKGHLEMVKYLNEVHNMQIDQTGINWVAWRGNMEILKYLESDKANVNKVRVNQEGLNKAVGDGRLTMVKYLLSKNNELQLIVPDNMKLIFDNFY